MMQFPVLIRTNFDDELQEWVAKSDDIDGFSVRAPSMDKLKARLPDVLSQFVDLKETIRPDGSIEIDGHVRVKSDQGSVHTNKGQRPIPYQIVLGTQRHAPLNVRVKRNIRLIGDNHAIETDIGVKAEKPSQAGPMDAATPSDQRVSKKVKKPEESAPQTGSPRKWTQVFFSS